MSTRARATAAALFVVWLAPLASQGEGTREFTITGCLLSNGYAGFQIEDAAIDAIDGKPVDGEVRSSGPTKWVLDGGGNLRRQTGEKVLVVGRSAWRAGATDEAPSTPRLEVTSVKTVA